MHQETKKGNENMKKYNNTERWQEKEERTVGKEAWCKVPTHHCVTASPNHHGAESRY
jgi:hypothetical protein